MYGQHKDSSILLQNLLESVRNCQKRFGGKTELATEFDQCVKTLCTNVEIVFLHGLRNKPLELNQSGSAGINLSNVTLKHVTDFVGNLNLGNDNQSFWNFLKLHLTKHEQERYNALKQIWTDTGKCRAWLRSALNEKTLERYFNRILSNKLLLRSYYEDWAFLCDDEKTSLLPNMAAGLGSILFAISIDRHELNSSVFKKSERVMQEPIIEAPITKSLNTNKKRRKVAKQIISFDDDIEDSKMQQPADMMNDNDPSTSDTQSTKSSESGDKVKSESHTPAPERKLSVETSGSRERYTTRIESLTPLDKEIGELTPITVEQDIEADDVEIPTDVSAVLTVIEEKNREEVERLQQKIENLTRENEILKERAEKYMEAVELAKGGQNEGEIFEQKLVQLAEMHAELMDFNTALQKQLALKEAVIEKLRGEVEMLNGPANEDEGGVNIWIPSAFLTGSGSEAHHVYQIFIRAGSDEWSIYRRYAQFHALHSDLKRLDSAIGNFDFPPKKSLRNKNSTIVEDRRKRFQIYLRRVLTHWPELSSCNSRFLLEQHLAFFKEDSNSNRSRSSTGPQVENRYAGL